MPIRPFQGGDPQLRAKLEWMRVICETVEKVRGSTFVNAKFQIGSGFNIDLNIDQVVARMPQNRVSLPQVFKLTEIHDDYLTCRTYNFGSVTPLGDTDFYVAKPFELQLTPNDGHTITFHDRFSDTDKTVTFSFASRPGYDPAINGTGLWGTEEWGISPPYYVGAIIVADSPIGGTGVFKDTTHLTLSDTNRAGRRMVVIPSGRHTLTGVSNPPVQDAMAGWYP